MPFDILFALLAFLTLVVSWVILPGAARGATAPAEGAPLAEAAGA
jgi:hypothetical protein